MKKASRTTKTTIVYGLGGEALMAPGHTETAFWAALGGGAEGIVTGVRLSRDGVVLCANQDTLESACGDTRALETLTWEDISALDVGATFRSTVLDDENQPTGIHGMDHPWASLPKKQQALRVPRLDRCLALFARRCRLGILVPSHGDLLDAVLALLDRYAVADRVLLLGEQAVFDMVALKCPGTPRGLLAPAGSHATEQLAVAEAGEGSILCLDWEDACPKALFNGELKKALAKSSVRLLLRSESMPFAPRPSYLAALRGVQGLEGILARGVLTTVQCLNRPGLIITEDFQGARLNTELWSAGYSHINQDTVISQNEGLHVQIKDGGTYSGAGAVCLMPLHGAFDAQIDFRVASPQQATTFEMAAICVDPGYDHRNNADLDTRSVNLCFDVHGAPPYASSERDEDDGFRCGWNNGYSLTKFDPDWQASSGNMYNKYGRDVGNAAADNPEGTLRLVRHGQVFATYYKDKYNEAWVCSGAMLVQSMAEDIYIRLAAKHWNKGGRVPPANEVWFRRFRLYQF